MPDRFKTILLFGAPGAGKGTQGKILGQIPGFFHLACGDVFRSLDTTSELGAKFLKFSSRGELVPDELTVQMWRQNMHAQTVLSLYKPKVDLLVLDGIPRSLGQAKELEQYIDVLKIIHLVCPDLDAMIERMKKRAIKENRLDDADERVIRRRFEVYDRETSPVLAHYPQDVVTEVSAIGPPRCCSTCSRPWCRCRTRTSTTRWAAMPDRPTPPRVIFRGPKTRRHHRPTPSDRSPRCRRDRPTGL